MSDKRCKVYFVSDVHLGLSAGNPSDREMRFVTFLRGIDHEDTVALYLLGDIWDFWYEYTHVVPKGYVRVFAELMRLIDNGVEVYFFPGNHDMWSFHYFSDMGIRILEQPYCVEYGGKVFCLGHGDGLGPVPFGYRFLRSIFANRTAQFLFSAVHPTIAFAFGNSWSGRSRKSHPAYVFKGREEPLYRFAEKFSTERKVDYFIFGHYHTEVDMNLATGARLLVMPSWMDASPYLLWDGISVFFGISKNIEK